MQIISWLIIFSHFQWSIAEHLYTGYIDDIPPHPQKGIRYKPSLSSPMLTAHSPPIEKRHPNFQGGASGRKPTIKPKPFLLEATESSCVKNARKKQEEDDSENSNGNSRPSGNRWHGPITYGREQFQHQKPNRRATKYKDITPVERKLHKCYKWIRSEDIKRYEWPAVIKKNELDNTVLIEICCPHFGPVRLMGNTLCQPYCQSCHNGKCIAPEVCQCYDGYVLSDNKDCVFTCPISCLNGRCNLLRGGCLCNSGYKLDETGQFCRPICRAGCGINPLHNCTAPDVCGCVKGFSLTDNDCQPIVGRGTWGRRY